MDNFPVYDQLPTLYSEVKVEKLEKIIEELKINQAKLVSDLKNCKTTESALTASRQAAKEFTKQLENENLKYKIEDIENRELMVSVGKRIK